MIKTLRPFRDLVLHPSFGFGWIEHRQCPLDTSPSKGVTTSLGSSPMSYVSFIFWANARGIPSKPAQLCCLTLSYSTWQHRCKSFHSKRSTILVLAVADTDWNSKKRYGGNVPSCTGEFPRFLWNRLQWNFKTLITSGFILGKVLFLIGTGEAWFGSVTGAELRNWLMRYVYTSTKEGKQRYERG